MMISDDGGDDDGGDDDGGDDDGDDDGGDDGGGDDDQRWWWCNQQCFRLFLFSQFSWHFMDDVRGPSQVP